MATTPAATEQVATREIPPLSMRAAFRPGSVDREKRTIEIVWTTGARVLRGFYDRYYEELSLDPKHVRMDRLRSGRAPLLNSHDGFSLASVLGVVESARLAGVEGTATVRFAKAEDDAEADKIFRKVADGIIANVSVGYRAYRYEKVEGGEEQIPVYRAVDWEPHEISLVGMGADSGAGTRAAPECGPMPCAFVSRSEESPMSGTAAQSTPATAPAAPPAPQPAAPQGAARTATGSAPAAAPEDAARAATEAATRAERERIIGIRQAVRAAKLGDELADELVNGSVSLDKARATVLERLAAADDKTRTEQHISVQGGDDEFSKWQRGAAAWLFQKAAVANTIARAQEAAPKHAAFRDVALDPGEFRGLSLVDLARESLERRGQKTRGLSRVDLVGKALTFRNGGLNSTSDYAVLLENVMHKTLLASYATTPDSWTRFCAVGSVSDFRVHNRYRLGSFGVLDALNEHGEYKNKVIPDGEKATIAARTKGNIIGLTRQAIIDDDLGAFNSLATRFGRAAKLSIEVDVFDLIKQNGGLGPTQADGQPLFHANRANVGAAAALSVDALDADRVVMAIQKDPSGNEILDLRPAILLVPIGLGGQAKVLNDSQFDASVSNKFQVPNKVRGLFREIVDTPRLTGTRRYLLADPGTAPVLEVAFLDGQREPFMESHDGWRVDGTEWKVRLDYGVAAIDYRGAVTNAGAA
jgi:hypothetical protein